ncbi:MAG: hypothetical protein J6K17_10540 [Oscillospiraceae bacterium]|nr:hypothetical protein [Oscillospiraceae bacterium]
MLNINDINAIVSDINALWKEYRDKYIELSNEAECISANVSSFQSMRTIHNIPNGIIPDTKSIVKEFEFPDKYISSEYWCQSKRHSYKIYRRNNNSIIRICADKKFDEYYMDNDTVICFDCGKISSVGKIKHSNGLISQTYIADILNDYSQNIDIVIKCNEYIYNDIRQLVKIITYIFDTTRKPFLIGADFIGSGKEFKDNPHIYEHEIHYNNNKIAETATVSSPFYPETRAVFKVKQQNKNT